MKEKQKKEIEKLNFEEAMNELENIADQLEKNQLSLNDSIEAYERAVFLKKHCENFLKKAEGKIEILSNEKNGKIVKRKFHTQQKSQEAFEEETPEADILF